MKKYIVRIMLGLLITSILAVPNAAGYGNGFCKTSNKSGSFIYSYKTRE